MKIRENILANSVHQINLMNTINGGITMTQVDLSQNEEGYLAVFRNPTLSGERYHIEINAGHLIVYTTLDDSYKSEFSKNQMKIVIPSFIRHFPIPEHVDAEKIEAVFEAGALRVFAPFKDGLDNSPKKIDIKFS